MAWSSRCHVPVWYIVSIIVPQVLCPCCLWLAWQQVGLRRRRLAHGGRSCWRTHTCNGGSVNPGRATGCYIFMPIACPTHAASRQRSCRRGSSLEASCCRLVPDRQLFRSSLIGLANCCECSEILVFSQWHHYNVPRNSSCKMYEHFLWSELRMWRGLVSQRSELFATAKQQMAGLRQRQRHSH